jgi:hypothetical protein
MSTLQAIGIIIGVASGVSGLVLGILNYLHQRDTTRPRIVVRLTRLPAKTPQQWTNVCFVQVSNVGQVPVMMKPIITLLPKRGQKDSLVVSFTPIKGGGLTDEFELNPQHAAWREFSLDKWPEGRELGRAFVKSVIGDKFEASPREVRRLTKQHKAAST